MGIVAAVLDMDWMVATDCNKREEKNPLDGTESQMAQFVL